MKDSEMPDKDRVTEGYPDLGGSQRSSVGVDYLWPLSPAIWCVINEMIDAGYTAALESYPDLINRATADEIGWFLHDVLENRKDFGRLLCVLADVERQEREACWDEHGASAVFHYGSGPEFREEVEPSITSLGYGNIIEVDPQNTPQGRKPWYVHPGKLGVYALRCLIASTH
jgi:hypothetical protein